MIFDEPTTGLHASDVDRLIELLHHLVQQGVGILIIEHNLDVVWQADWVIDLGPEGGAKGGQIIAQATPETLARTPASHTGRYLKERYTSY